MGQNQSELNEDFAKACMKGNLEKIKKYLEKGAQPNQWYILVKGNILLNGYSNVPGRSKYILDHVLLQRPINMDVVKILLDNKASCSGDSVLIDYTNKELIHILDNHNISNFTYKIHRLKDDEIYNIFSSYKRKPSCADLLYVLEKNREEVVKFFLEKDVLIDYRIIKYAHIYPKILEKCQHSDVLKEGFVWYLSTGNFNMCDLILKRAKALNVIICMEYEYVNSVMMNTRKVEYFLSVIDKITVFRNHVFSVDFIQTSDLLRDVLDTYESTGKRITAMIKNKIKSMDEHGI